MVKVIYNDQLVYKVVIWAFFGISLWTEKVALICLKKHSYTLQKKDTKTIYQLFVYYFLYPVQRPQAKRGYRHVP